MKPLLRLALVAIGLLLAHAAPAQATTCALGTPANTCYLIASGNAGSTGTWSYTSGGASCTCFPSTTDSVVLDSNSNTFTLTFNAAITIINLTSTCTCTISITANGTPTLTGNFSIGSGTTYTATAGRTLSFTGTGGTSGTPNTISTSGQTLPNVTINGSGGYYEVENALVLAAASTLTITAGTLDFTTNNPTVSAGQVTNAGTMNCGTGTWSITGVGTNTTGGVANTGTVSCASNAINLTSTTPATNRTFTSGGGTWGAISVAGYSSTLGYVVTFTLSSGDTFSSLTLNGPSAAVFTANKTLALTNMTVNGTISAPVLLQGNYSSGTPLVTFTVTNAPAMIGAALQFTKFTNAATAKSSIDLGGNSGVTINTPSDGGHIIGG